MIDESPAGRSERLRGTVLPAAAAMLSLLVFALSANVLPATLLHAAPDLGVSPEVLATLASVQFAAFFVASAGAGILSDGHGKKRVFVAACVLLLAGSALWASARHVSLAAGASLCWGAAGGIFEGLSSALLCDLFPTRRKLTMSLSQVVYTVGAVGGPWVAGLILPRGGDWRWLFAGVGALSGVLLAIYLACHLPAPPPHERITRRRLTGIVRSWTFLMPCAVLFLYVFCESGLAVYSNLYLRRAHAAPENWAIYSISIFWASMLVGRLACAALPEHHSYEKTLVVLLVLSGAAAALQGVATSWQTSVALFALAGLTFAGAWPLTVALAASRADGCGATVVGLTIAAGSLGCVASPPVMGLLLETLPPAWVFVVMSGSMFLAAVLVIARCERRPDAAC